MAACICMLFGASMFAYTIGAICSIVSSFGEDVKECVPNCIVQLVFHAYSVALLVCVS